MVMRDQKENEFYDINKFPKESGIFYLGLSIPLLNNVQNPRELYKMDLEIIEKLRSSNTGVHIVYTDNLYLYSDEPAMKLKLKHQKMIEDHKKGWLKLIKKNINLIPKAFNFITWSQLLLNCEDFSYYFDKFKDIYKKDKDLQRYVREDIERAGREVTEYTIGYILEEILLDYLLTKGRVTIKNDYTQNKHKWILNCYHGKPHSSHVYLHQKNFFRLENKENLYEDSWYDLKNKKLYNFMKINLKTFEFKDKKK